MSDEKIISPVSYRYNAPLEPRAVAKSSAPASVDAIVVTVIVGNVAPAGEEAVVLNAILIAAVPAAAPVIAELAQLS